MRNTWIEWVIDGEFNRCRGCGTWTGHFTPDDRGYGELNRYRDSREV